MCPGGSSSRPTEATAVLRRRPVPLRALGDSVIVARPGDGSPVVLAPTAAFVWRLLDGPTTEADIDRRLADAFPAVTEPERATALAQILDILWDDGLLERG
jgi:hypothetical protein